MSAAAVEQLAATKPWVRFISVMMFIGAGLMLLAAAGMVVMSVVGGTGGTLGNPAKNPLAGPMGFAMAALYVALSIIYVFPGVKLWKYASSIAMLLQTGRNGDLVAALNQQRSFWKFIGVFLIVILAVYIIAIIGLMAFAGITAFKGH